MMHALKIKTAMAEQPGKYRNISKYLEWIYGYMKNEY